ncbi:MAG TPA: hypothetical protein VIY48_02820, partial [Candidatus Paceibacterota bacterium]
MEDDHVIITPFKEFRGVYEHRKAKAFASHLRLLAERAELAQSVQVCPKAPDRPWISLQEWITNHGHREGQWGSDIEFVNLP